MLVSKWGNSLAIRLPATVVDALDLKEGDEVDIRAAGQTAFEVSRADRQALIEKLRKFRGMLPADFKFDRDEANAR